jgi:hypothetical protein
METRSHPFQLSHHVSLLHDVPVLLFKVAHKELKKSYRLTELQLLVLLACDKVSFMRGESLHRLGSGLRASGSYLVKRLITDGYMQRKQAGKKKGFCTPVHYYITGTGKMIVREFYATQEKLLSVS